MSFLHDSLRFTVVFVLLVPLAPGCSSASAGTDEGPDQPDAGSVDAATPRDDGPLPTDDGPPDAGGAGVSDTFYRVCDIANPDCAEGEECTIFGLGEGVCVPTCVTLGSEEECPDGFSCQVFLSPDSDFRCQPTTDCTGGCDADTECVEIGCLGMWCVPTVFEVPSRTCG
ncbi:MAG: hypothetical protein ACFCGT_04900 [Sandaracinaceae bacterium]